MVKWGLVGIVLGFGWVHCAEAQKWVAGTEEPEWQERAFAGGVKKHSPEELSSGL